MMLGPLVEPQARRQLQTAQGRGRRSPRRLARSFGLTPHLARLAVHGAATSPKAWFPPDPFGVPAAQERERSGAYSNDDCIGVFEFSANSCIFDVKEQL